MQRQMKPAMETFFALRALKLLGGIVNGIVTPQRSFRFECLGADLAGEQFVRSMGAHVILSENFLFLLHVVRLE